MRIFTKPLLALVAILLATGVFVHFYTNTDLPQKTIAKVTPIQPLSTDMEEEGEGGEQKKENAKERMEQEFRKIRDPRTNEVPIERLMTASRIADQLLDQPNRSDIGKLEWEERGPDNVGGRTRAILVDAADPTNNTVIAGGVNGGIWRTTNFLAATPKWTKNNDFFDNLAVSSIIQDPTDPSIIYFGTGEGWFNGDAARGLGIWKSTKGGANFFPLPSTANNTFGYVLDLEIDNNGALYAATRNGGIQRSTDGGQTWSQVLGSNVGQGAHNEAADLEIAVNGDLYATFGTFSAGSIWKSSVHKGAFLGTRGHWQEITPTQGRYERIELAVAPSNPWTLYAVAQGEFSSDAEYFFQSKDGGKTWTSKPVPTIYDRGIFPPFTRGQAWYDLIIAVHPEKEDHLYMGGVDIVRTRDGGDSWEQVSNWAQLIPGLEAPGYTADQYVHADIHEIQFLPNRLGEEIIIGSDGGVFHGIGLNYEDRLPIFRERNSGYNVTQYYGTAAHPSQGSNYFLAGSQDNGSHQFKDEGINSIVEATGADGGFCHIDQNNPNVQITTAQNNVFFFSLNGGKSFEGVAQLPGGVFFINPSDYDNDAQKLYIVHHDFSQLDQQNPNPTFRKGTILRWNDPAQGGLSFDLIPGTEGVATHIMVDPNTDDRIWVGLTSFTPTIAFIDKASTAAPEIVNLPPPPGMPPLTFVSGIAVDENDPSHLVVSFSNYGVISVWEVRDADKANPTWINVEGSLPDMPVRWCMFMPGSSEEVLLATELGVWGTQNLNGDQTHWLPTNRGLAHTRVDMLQLRASDGLIAAATHGRGLFTTGGEKATCGDGVQNGDETGVDCGGPLCGPCMDYCEAGGATSHFEWIDKVEIGAFENISGNDAGYGDYTHLTIPLPPGETITFELTPNIEFSGFSQYYTLWIDYNKDLDFDDPGEEVFRAQMGVFETLYQLFTVPEGLTGETRLRITQEDFPGAGACDGFGYGETEDYTVHFTNCGVPENITCVGLFGNSVAFEWQEVIDATAYELQYRLGFSNVWKKVHVSGTRYTLTVPAGSTITYRVRSICPLGVGPYSRNHSFSFRGAGTASLAEGFNILGNIFPNPIVSDFTIQYSAVEEGMYEIFDASGKNIQTGVLSRTDNGYANHTVNAENWTAGTYFIRVRLGEEVFSEQVIKQ